VLSEHGIQIAPSTYYAFKKRLPSPRSLRDGELKEVITAVFHDRDKGRGLAGARKMWHLLRRDGIVVARCTLERLMRDLGLQGARRGRTYTTTVADPAAERAPDLVKRDFSAPAPNRLWLVDFTYVPTWTGMVFTAFVTDAFSRRIVGWRTATRHLTELPLDALEMALWIRGRAGQDVTGMIHHSDAGSEYTAIRYRSRLHDVGALASIGTVGDSYDNALAETTIGLYKTECIRHDGPWRGVEDVELATCSWVDWFNTHRLHSAVGYLPPIEYENLHHHREMISREHQLAGQPSL
jgi:putative transposase